MIETWRWECWFREEKEWQRSLSSSRIGAVTLFAPATFPSTVNDLLSDQFAATPKATRRPVNAVGPH